MSKVDEVLTYDEIDTINEAIDIAKRICGGQKDCPDCPFVLVKINSWHVCRFNNIPEDWKPLNERIE